MKKIIDALTVLLLVGAFGMAFYTGFIGENTIGEPLLKTNLFAIISIAGIIVLLVVGMVSALISRAKNDLITNSFLAFAIVQILAVIAMSLVMCMIWTGMFPLDTKLIWGVYIVSAALLIVGYVDAIMLTDVIARRDEDEDNEEDGDDDSDVSDEDDADEAGDDSEYFAKEETVLANDAAETE